MAHKKLDQNESMTTYLALLLNNYNFTNSDGKDVKQYGSQFVYMNCRYRIKKEKETYKYIKGNDKKTGINNKVRLLILHLKTKILKLPDTALTFLV